MADLESRTDAIASAPDRDGWLAAMDEDGEEAGYFQTVGKRHWAHFADEAPTLLVGFETIESARARPGQRPVVQRVAARQGWSHLTLIADGATFWRDKAVWAWMDRLVDDAFFEDFDRVLFYGGGLAGYAAAAYAVAAPGARVFLTSARATMAPSIAGWDNRDRQARGIDFTSRYGFAPDMVEGTAQVVLAYDPMELLDSMHAALFRGPHVTAVPLPRAGANVEATLERLGVLDGLIESAVQGQLDRGALARAWRKRRDDATYLKATLAQVAQSGHPVREKMVCRSVVARMKMPRFARRLAEIEGAKG